MKFGVVLIGVLSLTLINCSSPKVADDDGRPEIVEELEKAAVRDPQIAPAEVVKAKPVATKKRKKR